MEFDDETKPESSATLTANRNQSVSEGQLTVDIYEDDGDIVVKSTIAGVSPDEIDIAITKDNVTIRGTRAAEQRVKTSAYYHRELYWGAFSRSIILPEAIDPDKAKASMKNGLLTLRLPKLSKVRTKKLKIAS